MKGAWAKDRSTEQKFSSPTLCNFLRWYGGMGRGGRQYQLPLLSSFAILQTVFYCFSDSISDEFYCYSISLNLSNYFVWSQSSQRTPTFLLVWWHITPWPEWHSAYICYGMVELGWFVCFVVSQHCLKLPDILRTLSSVKGMTGNSTFHLIIFWFGIRFIYKNSIGL